MEQTQLAADVERLVERLEELPEPVVESAFIAVHLDVKLGLVRVEAAPQVVRGRLETRLGDSKSKSDADWAMYQRMRPLAQKIHRKHYAVDTSRDLTPVLGKIMKEVRH